MAKKKFNDPDLPVYEIYVDEEEKTGIRFISLVQEPAIEIQGMAFDNEKDLMEFKKVDQQKIAGYFMVPDKLIFRRDDKKGDYYVKFSADTIQQMMMRFNKYNNNKAINVDHTTEMANAFICENWIIEDEYYDKSRKYGFDSIPGAWFGIVKIEDEKFWKEKVKGEGRYSFSVEGLMSQRPATFSKEENFNQIIDELSDEDLICLMVDLQRDKISFDFDKTLEKPFIQKIAKKKS
jgi:hypothetical protein